MLQGQLHAVWTHRVDDKQVAAIKSGRFPMMVIHGRYDILAGKAFIGHCLQRQVDKIAKVQHFELPADC